MWVLSAFNFSLTQPGSLSIAAVADNPEWMASHWQIGGQMKDQNYCPGGPFPHSAESWSLCGQSTHIGAYQKDNSLCNWESLLLCHWLNYISKDSTFDLFMTLKLHTHKITETNKI